jgi:hypothetical protein
LDKQEKSIFMSRVPGLVCLIAFIFLLASCSKKSHPSQSSKATITPISGIATPSEVARTKEKEEVAEKKKVVKATPKEVFPDVITVNDSAAHKSVDGRYYYDVLGHRYWRNNKDGKYYLFNKSMYNNPDFKPQSK